MPVIATLALLAMGGSKPLTVAPASKFVDFVGVHSQLWGYKSDHADFSDLPPDPKLYHSVLRPRIAELGIRHMRMALPSNPVQLGTMRDLATLGVKVTAIVEPDRFGNDYDKIVSILRSIRPVLEAVEGPNEPDNRGKNEWLDEEIATLRRLRQALKGDPELRNLPLIGPALTQGRPQGRLTTPFQTDARAVGPLADYGNVHMYDKPVPHPADSYDVRAFAYRKTPYHGLPIIATETGYPTSTDEKGVSERTQAKFILRRLFDYRVNGMVRTYIYDLIDLSTNHDDAESNFGLLRHDGSPKPAFQALAQVMEWMAQPSATKVRSMNISISSPKIRSAAYGLRDGILLVLWNPSTSTSGDENVRTMVNLGRRFPSIVRMDPLDRGRKEILSPGRTVLTDVPDWPIVLRLRG
ncbi:hypothetical protein EON82_16355 [bacterium]|nr:MAG: hypothetical protein EON82_16355 [bacterium]